MEVIRSYNIFLDSLQRSFSDVGNPASYGIFLNKVISKISKNSVFRVKVFQACIPYSFTEINITNNVLTYSFNATQFSLTIPVGSYNILALLDYIKTQLQILHTIELDFVFNASTNLSTFTFTTNNTGSKIILFDATIQSNVKILKQLGIISSKTFSYVSGVITSAIGDQSVNVSPSKNLYIRSDNLQQSQAQEAIITPTQSSDILCIVPINVPYSNFINFFDMTNFYCYLTNDTIDFISLYLTDATTDDVLTGLQLNWSVSLIIDEIEIPYQINIEPYLEENTISTRNNERITSLEKEKDNELKELEEQKTKLEKEIREITQKKKGKKSLQNGVD
jgi:hypothetical protein